MDVACSLGVVFEDRCGLRTENVCFILKKKSFDLIDQLSYYLILKYDSATWCLPFQTAIRYTLEIAQSV